MRLDQFLSGMESCPDESLQNEYGIHDNWTMFLFAPFDVMLNLLNGSGKYNLILMKQHLCRYEYIPGTVILQVLDGLFQLAMTGIAGNENEHTSRQRRDYSISIIFHDN